MNGPRFSAATGRKRRPKCTLPRLLAILVSSFAFVFNASAGNVDPLAANNGLYPSAEQWSGPYRVPNLVYPQTLTGVQWQSPAAGRLTAATAGAYAAAIFAQLAGPTSMLQVMVNHPNEWDPGSFNWYSMVWTGQGSARADGSTDPTSGLEAIIGAASGQILQSETFPSDPPEVPFQVHQVTYYNEFAATLLGRVWANLYKPDLSDPSFPAGSMIVKTEASTATPDEWPVLQGAAEWQIFRPTVAAQLCAQALASAPKPAQLPPACAGVQNPGTVTAEVLNVRVLQLSVAVKDPIASPDTGWVFLAFTYKANAPGETPWDRFVPLGVQWGNDPNVAGPKGRGDSGDQVLAETWINPGAPAFTGDTLGWGERLAGPMDVATRHEVITVDGTRYRGRDGIRASGCLSCHGAAEFPVTTNLYPSPNTSFPRDGDPDNPFLLYNPGSPQWMQWFQNRPGSQPMSPSRAAGVTALDYDWTIVFAIIAFNAAMGNDIFVRDRFDAH